jgi:hypothetical protein
MFVAVIAIHTGRFPVDALYRPITAFFRGAQELLASSIGHATPVPLARNISQPVRILRKTLLVMVRR